MQKISIVAFLLACSICESQILSWKSPVDGSFSDPNNWLPNNQPNSPTETILFNRFGDYDVNFDQPVGSSLNELEVTEGKVRFFSSTSDQTLTIENDTQIDNAELELDRLTSPGDIHLQIGGQLSLWDGALLSSLRQSSLSANSTMIEAGNNNAATELLFR